MRWSHLSDSNRRPSAYKAGALPTELRWPARFRGRLMIPTVSDYLAASMAACRLPSSVQFSSGVPFTTMCGVPCATLVRK